MSDKGKASFNFKSSLLEHKFKEKVAAEAKSMTFVLYSLIENYVNGKTQFDDQDTVKGIVEKLRLLLATEKPNQAALQGEVENLWRLVQS